MTLNKMHQLVTSILRHELTHKRGTVDTADLARDCSAQVCTVLYSELQLSAEDECPRCGQIDHPHVTRHGVCADCADAAERVEAQWEVRLLAG